MNDRYGDYRPIRGCPRCGGALLPDDLEVVCVCCGYRQERVPEHIVQTIRQQDQQVGRGRKRGGSVY